MDENRFETVLRQRLSRRRFLKGTAAGATLLGAGRLSALHPVFAQARGFSPVPASHEDRLVLPPGYRHTVLLRWGDPLGAAGPAFDPRAQTPAKQAQQFGYNADYTAYMPLPRGGESSTRGLLVVNHETVPSEMIWPGWDRNNASKTAAMVETEIAGHGLSVVEVGRNERGEWSYVQGSAFNRRITGDTPFTVRGPAVGHPLMMTSASAGLQIRGTLNNCAGGVTPWGTVLSGEENIQNYFAGRAQDLNDPSLRALHTRYGVGTGRYGWERFHDRFDIRLEPHEPNRFGWVVEIDPYDPQSPPTKHTALGRLAHEGATVVVARSGYAVAYMGDDGRYEYVYKFVSSRRYDPADRRSNMQLLNSGTLYAAKFNDDGTGEWLPLVHGQGPLTDANGFRSQAEVVINARRAGDVVGATKMDRPEEVEANPSTGKVYIVLTSNDRRRPEEVNKANPRANNRFGHIIELIEQGGEHTSIRFRWEMFLLCGDPKDASHGAWYQGRTDVSVLANPDNLAFDNAGRMWICTDGNEASLDVHDGVFVAETEGALRGRVRRFVSGPTGGELTGPAFTPDNTTFFVAVQHPGRTDGATIERPASRWPDYKTDMPPRPSVVAIMREDGRVVGE